MPVPATDLASNPPPDAVAGRSPDPLQRYILVTSHYAPLYEFGGPVRLAAQYAAAAAAVGIAPQVLTIASSAELLAAERACREVPASVDGVASVQRLPLARRSLVGQLFAVPAAFGALWRTTRGARRIVLHLCEYRSPLTFGAVLALRARRTAAHLVRRDIDTCIVHSAFGQLQPPDRLDKRLFDRLHRVLTRPLPYTVLAQNGHESALATRFFAAHRGLDVRLLPLSTDGDPTLPADASSEALTRRRRAARVALGLDEAETVLVFLGRWVPAKGIERLMRAVARLPGSLRPVLLVAGADFGIGESLRALADELGIAERTRFLTDVSTRRFELYAASDAFVAAPTLFEETMLASVEALSVGTPILVSREADIPYVEEAGAGAVIDFDDARFARALGAILADREGHSRRARSIYRQRFDERELTREIGELFGAEYGVRSSAVRAERDGR